MGKKGDDDGGEVEQGVGNKCPDNGKTPDIRDIEERKVAVLRCVVDGLDIEGRERGSAVARGRPVRIRHLDRVSCQPPIMLMIPVHLSYRVLAERRRASELSRARVWVS